MNEHVHAGRDALAELNRHRLVPPSPALKARVMGAARDAWTRTEEPPVIVPWATAALRLAASAAAAALLVCCAHRADRSSLARWQPERARLSPALPAAAADSGWRAAPAFAGLARIAAMRPGAQPVKALLCRRAEMRALMRTLDAERAGGRGTIGSPQSRSRRERVAPVAC